MHVHYTPWGEYCFLVWILECTENLSQFSDSIGNIQLIGSFNLPSDLVSSSNKNIFIIVLNEFVKFLLQPLTHDDGHTLVHAHVHGVHDHAPLHH